MISFEIWNLNFSGSHKCSLVLFQITCYIYLRVKPMKSVEKNTICFKLFGYKLFCSLKIKVIPFPDGFMIRTPY